CCRSHVSVLCVLAARTDVVTPSFRDAGPPCTAQRTCSVREHVDHVLLHAHVATKVPHGQKTRLQA
ncbi:MAG: hypothetical protein ACR2JB_26080, partial [Bryobacteraceae bacterium]